MRQSYLLWLLPSLIAGCASVYTPQPGEPTARLRLVYPASAPGSYGYSVSALDNCPAEPARLAYGAVVDAPGRLGMPHPPAPGTRTYSELVIPANKPLGMTTGSVRVTPRRQTNCDIAFRFDPKAGDDYELEYVYSQSGEQCAMVMRTMAPGATQWQREASVRRVPPSFARPDFCAVP
ncbi:hypothetical protein [Ottowia testudinis]|uniref:Lipoprotein n=1 Tax=Ottowia testudinis TaxID=2816950 RepID=A0A975H358_9BURK|nr:hypothetical protein [Ottowia testudinis]QTD44896.1 hypothetical protein J1M35_17875 [Ottowia testudinis]